MKHTEFNTNYPADGQHDLRAVADFAEEHSDLWIEVPFLSVVRGCDAGKQAFEELVSLDSLSKDRLSFRIRRSLPLGTRLFVCIRLSNNPANERALWVATYGRVSQIEERPGQVSRFEMRISHYRFVHTRLS